MKKLILLMIFGIFLVGGIGFVAAECNSTTLNECLDETNCTAVDVGGFWYDDVCNAEEEVVLVCDSDNLDLCLDETTCEDASGKWEDDVCVVDDDDDDNSGGKKQGLGQTIRNRVKAGVYTSPTGEQIRVSELAKNRLLLHFDEESVDAETELEIEEETENNKTKLKAKLNNGRSVEIKIMPGVASERALERLKLNFCNADNNCSIELKEVAVKRRADGNDTSLAYEIQIQRHHKLLGMFRIKANNRVQVDAETGEIISVKKPWWAFLATEPAENEE